MAVAQVISKVNQTLFPEDLIGKNDNDFFVRYFPTLVLEK
jgi:hypothetical protein